MSHQEVIKKENKKLMFVIPNFVADPIFSDEFLDLSTKVLIEMIPKYLIKRASNGFLYLHIFFPLQQKRTYMSLYFDSLPVEQVKPKSNLL